MSDNNILKNGNFENTSANEATDAIDHGTWFTAQSIDGWTASAGRIEIQHDTGRHYGTPVDETGVLSSGSVLELDSDDTGSGGFFNRGREADSTVEQSFKLEDDGAFTLGFSYAARFNARTSDFEVQIWDADGNVVFSREFSKENENLKVEWARFEQEIKLNAGDYTLAFSSRNSSDGDTVGALIDNVSLVNSGPDAVDDGFTLDLGESEVLNVDAVIATETREVEALNEDFSGARYNLERLETIEHSDLIGKNGTAFSNSYTDGVLLFKEVDIAALDEAKLTFFMETDGRNRSGFEASDSRYGDSIRVEVSIDGGEFVLLDLFEVAEEDIGLPGDEQTFVGSITGQTYDASGSTLNYDLPDGAESAQLRFVTNLTARDEIIRLDDVVIAGQETVETGFTSGLLANDTDGNDQPLEIISANGTDLFQTVEEEVTVFEEDLDDVGRNLEHLDTVNESDLIGKNGVARADKYRDGELEFEQVDISGLSGETFSFSLNADTFGHHRFEGSGRYRDYVEVQARFDDGSYETIDTFDVIWRDGAQVFVGRESGQEIAVEDGFVDLSYDLAALAGDASTAQLRLVAEVTGRGEIFEVDNVSLIGTQSVRTGEGIATITLDSGAIATIKSDGSFSYNANGQFAFLAENEAATDAFTYTVVDVDGNIDTASVTINLIGANEGVEIVSAVTAGAVTELTEADADHNVAVLSTTGTIDFQDADLADIHIISALPSAAGYLGNFNAVLADTATGDGSGQVNWTFDVPDADLNSLAEGEVLTQTYVVTIDDQQGGVASETVTVTINGTNDAPVANDDFFSSNADEILTTSQTALLANDIDVDGDVLSIASIASESTNGAIITSNTDGSITYDPSGVAAIQALSEGETLIDTFEYTVTDENGATSTATASVTVTGTNSAPIAVDDIIVPQDERVANEVTEGFQGESQVTYLDSGKFVLTWISFNPVDGATIRARIFNEDGSPATNEFRVDSDSDPSGLSSSGISITEFGENEFAVTWANESNSIQVKTFTQEGQESRFETIFTSDQEIANIDMATIADSSGKEAFAFSWNEGIGSTPTVRTVVADADDLSGSESTVISADASLSQIGSKLTELDNGNFIVTWTDFRDTSTSNIFARIIDADNNPVSDQFQVNRPSADRLAWSDVTQLENGNLAFIWTEGPGAELKSVVFSQEGTPISGETVVDFDSISSFTTAVEALSNGNYVVVWQDSSPEIDGSATAIVARIFDEAGSPTGPKFVVNQSAERAQLTPDVAANDDGGFTVTFTTSDAAQDGDNAAVLYITFDENGNVAGSVGEDETLAISQAALLANDTDVDGDALSIVGVAEESANGASVTLNGDGTITYDPSAAATIQMLVAGETLTDTFEYTISGGNGATSTATVSVTVTGADDDPILNDDFFSSDADAILTTSQAELLANDTDADGGMLVIAAVAGQSANGATITSNPDGSITYDPTGSATIQALAEGETLTDTFGYFAVDEQGSGGPATVNVTVTGANDAPIAVDDVIVSQDERVANELTDGFQGNSQVIYLDNGKFVLAWISFDEIEGDSIRARIFNEDGSPATNEFRVDPGFDPLGDGLSGFSISEFGDNEFAVMWVDDSNSIQVKTYTDEGQESNFETIFTGDTSIIEVEATTITDDVGNEAFAIAWNQETATAFRVHTAVVSTNELISVSDNVISTEGTSSLNSSRITGLDNGNFIVTWSGSLRSSPSAIFARIVDANNNPVGDSFQVSLPTRDNLDWPDVTTLENGNIAFIWIERFGTELKSVVFSQEGTPISRETVVDSDLILRNTANVEALSNGNYVVTWADGSSTNDGSASAILARIFDENGSPIGPKFVVNQSAEGFQTFPYLAANDDGGFTVTFTTFDAAQDGDDAAVLYITFDENGNVAGSVGEDETLALSQATLLANDTDVDGDALSIVSVAEESANGASVTLNGDGTITYDPSAAAAIQALAEGETLNDTFEYTIADGNGATSTATMTLTVSGANDAPVANDDFFEISSDEVLRTPVSELLSNDTDVDGDVLSIETISSRSFNGASIFSGRDGTITYDPSGSAAIQALSEGQTLTDIFLYTIVDENGATSNAIVEVTVSGARDTPVMVLNQPSGSVIAGDDGDNRLVSTLADDLMIGNGGADTFVFDLNSGNDTIEDFNEALDLIELAAGITIATSNEVDVNNDGVADTVLDLSDDSTVSLLNVSGIADPDTLLV